MFLNQHVEHVDLVPLAIRDMEEKRDDDAQVQRVQLDRALVVRLTFVITCGNWNVL